MTIFTNFAWEDFIGFFLPRGHVPETKTEKNFVQFVQGRATLCLN